MNPRIPLSFIIPFLLLGLLAMLACAGDPGNELAGPGGDLGALEGTVHFVGVPCPPTHPSRPPCDGPYPDYEVVVQDDRGEAVVARTRTDDEGFYRVDLPVGDYVVFTTQGVGELFIETNRFSIVDGQITILNLVIDTGVR
jgi:hypothetical protein